MKPGNGSASLGFIQPQPGDPAPGMAGGGEQLQVAVDDDGARLAGIGAGRGGVAQPGSQPGRQQRCHAGDEGGVAGAKPGAAFVAVQGQVGPAHAVGGEGGAELVAQAGGAEHLPPQRVAVQSAAGGRAEHVDLGRARCGQTICTRRGLQLEREKAALIVVDHGVGGGIAGGHAGSRVEQYPAPGVEPDRAPQHLGGFQRKTSLSIRARASRPA